MIATSSPVCAALVVAAGRGSRFGGDQPKQYAPLAGVPVLRRTLDALRRHARIGPIQVVIHPDDGGRYAQAVEGLALLPPVEGGATRQDSVRRGLDALAAAAPDLVIIHDAARPLVDTDTISRVLDALGEAPGALAALPVVDTVHRVEHGMSTATVDRDGLWLAQTPQGFRFADIHAAHHAAAGRDLTDDVAVARLAGLEIRPVPGHPDNFKITTADDMTRAERLLRAQRETRTGQGFDVHRFGPGDHVMLCGVAVPHAFGLEGHSDADVGLHALTDALLGAIGAGDIGQHFPPSDPKWRGAESGQFLRHAAQLVRERGGRIVHVDVTLICERPKVGPHRPAMVARMASLLDLAPGRVSVKATTTERLGFTGRGEGIAAQAVATVELPGDEA